MFFKETCPIYLSCSIYRCKVVHNIPLIILLISVDSIVVLFRLFLILVLCVLFLTQQSGYTWSILVISKNQLLLDWFSPLFCVLYFIDFCLNLYYSLSILSLVFALVFRLLWKKLNALRPFFSFFSNTVICCYNFSPKYCLSSSPQMLICCVSIFIQFQILSNFSFYVFCVS